jgi:hypothetical protein
LLPLSSPRACSRDFATAPVSRYLAVECSSQQAGFDESGSKLPHSKASPALLIELVATVTAFVTVGSSFDAKRRSDCLCDCGQ